MAVVYITRLTTMENHTVKTHALFNFCRRCIGLFIVLLLLQPATIYADITLESLLEEMTDLKRLAVMSSPHYITRQFSSYDRRSTDPTEQTDENWFANVDAGQFIRTEETEHGIEYVMMEAEGPGAIVRIWSANADGAGTIRFYFEGEETPSIEMPFEAMMRGDTEPFIAPIVGVRAMGWNNYLPIPYKESIRITADNTPFYYLINYRTYEPGTVVESFTLESATSALPKIHEVASALASPKSTGKKLHQNLRSQRYSLQLEPGEMRTFEPLTGPGAIYCLTVKPEADDLEAALRATVLEITFDDQTLAAVNTPLGDFFGTAPGVNPYESLPAGYTEAEGFYSHWIMPFEKKAVVQLRNTGDTAITLTGEWVAGPWDWTSDSLYFHAKWRNEWNLETIPRQDWNYAQLQGRGRYVGNMLAVANPTPMWWGEGDEKIYIDGETFPSHFGTGTEDYYGYAWCSPELFTHAYHNQSRCDGPANYGHTSVNRFHIMDDIPYNESLRFDMEVWHWEDVVIHQAAISYWYAHDNQDNFLLLKDDTLTVPELDEFLLKSVDGALEGEDMRVISVTGGRAISQLSMAWSWSRGAQVWWIDASPADTLELGFEVEEAGSYEIFLNLTHAPDYGIFSLEINGQPVDGTMDLYAESVTNPDSISIGNFNLHAGENKMKIKIEGHNPEAIPAYMFGLDYMLLSKSN